MSPPTKALPRESEPRSSSGRYSGWRLVWEGLRAQRGWSRAWAKAAPRARYRVVIVGGGGHGLATAFYLATHYGIRDVAVLEKGPIGLGNVGRNTTIIRSNYFRPDNIRFYEFSLKLWEGLERTLNFNTMVSQRGTLNLFHTEAQRDLFTRRANAMRLEGAAGGPGQRPLPGAGRLPAAARRHGASRCGGLGLRARRLRGGRRHHRELRGHRHCA
jgi:glycine/D-amino acid oxidase-like deaminating enzyme